MFGGPEGRLHVSEAPRFLWSSGNVGWQGVFVTELWTAPAGIVDHAHELYCLRRALTPYHRRPNRRAPWERVSAGHWSLWRPGDAQRSEWRDPGRRQFAFLSPLRVEEVLEGRLPDHERWRRPEVAPVVERLLDALSADLAAGSATGPLLGDCIVAALCVSLFEPACASKLGGLTAAARGRVLDRMAYDLARRLTLDELAAEAGLSVRQFCRAFRASTGTSPHQYLLQQRIARAQRLIALGRPLAEVALECGFADQSQLTRVFARHVGLSPALYRRTLRR
jgi:AraC family transcriptional regulator